ncbi:prepilin-type N-terminal cleavage/methylation domain-containing protein [Sulfurimonas marina]|uniref:Prepilin-type N-terminal cleavage/methylation domain-containing protein n=1 Tax=Sulfurimonas marina TaxID=2590551 RepID=A0A7M1AW83_9BACT|nr:prepilin-type N-terminal cleavage/methylation domain-containing protein [Sulfurimonas marina]QOP41713.1 prepilin-type N-terminal cleavage/methylation domain-containing protein [Sulfurimonas marina]
MRKAFTLIELMISIVILSIIMVFLYKSYAELNGQNKIYKEATDKIEKIESIKQTIFLDLSMSFQETIVILPQDKKIDILFFQSSHSIHDRINPYIGYIVQDKKLYRIESLQVLKAYPLDSRIDFDIDYLGKVNNFRIYPSQKEDSLYLVDVSLKDLERILMKIKSFS